MSDLQQTCYTDNIIQMTNIEQTKTLDLSQLVVAYQDYLKMNFSLDEHNRINDSGQNVEKLMAEGYRLGIIIAQFDKEKTIDQVFMIRMKSHLCLNLKSLNQESKSIALQIMRYLLKCAIDKAQKQQKRKTMILRAEFILRNLTEVSQYWQYKPSSFNGYKIPNQRVNIFYQKQNLRQNKKTIRYYRSNSPQFMKKGIQLQQCLSRYPKQQAFTSKNITKDHKTQQLRSPIYQKRSQHQHQHQLF